MDKKYEDLAAAILNLKTICENYMLPLVDIGFAGDIDINSVHGIGISNRLLSEDNIGNEDD